MILLVDIGNTRIKWATLVANQFSYGGAFAYHGQSLAELFSQHWAQLAGLQRVIVSNVGGQKVQTALKTWLKQNGHSSPEFVIAQAKAHGLTLGYQNAASFGMDRWLAMLALWQETEAAYCLIGAGSAITVDVVDKQGQHHGSLIVPGLALARQAMAQLDHCALPDTYPWPGTLALGHATFDAIAQGILQQAVDFINSQIKHYRQQLGPQLACYIAGGDGETLLPFLAGPIQLRNYLVLEGLAKYAVK